MQFTQVDFGEDVPVDGYGPGFFRIGGQVHRGDLTLLSGRVEPWGGYDDLAALLAADGVDLLFVGTGPELTLPPAPFTAALQDAGIAVEPMPTPAACRTYNVVLAEGRRVGLAVFAL